MQGASHAFHMLSSGSLRTALLSCSHTLCWDCSTETWLLLLPTQLGSGDRKLSPIVHAAASQENKGKLAVSDYYSGCQTVHPSDHVIILLFMPGPPRIILSPFPMTTQQKLGTHYHIAQSLLCPSLGIPGLLSHSFSVWFGV